jgi:photosystem II stability/assembly factor-like uncharacterized protein
MFGLIIALPAYANDGEIKYSNWSIAKKIVWTKQIYFNFVNDVALGQDGYAYAACDKGILKISEDKGETWRTTPTPLYENLQTVRANDAGLVIVTGGRHYAISPDHGKTWKQFSLRPGETVYAKGVLPNNQDIIWLVLAKDPGSQKGEKGTVTLRTTSDGGAHWREPPIALVVKFDRIQPIDKVNAWAKRGSEFFHTTNGGLDWEKYPGIKLEEGDYVDFSFSMSESIMLATFRGKLITLSQLIN